MLFAAACGTTTPDEPAAPPAPTSYEEEVRRAAKAADREPKVVRYNPVRCNCPPFEVQLGPRWIRVTVEGIEDVASPAGQLAAAAAADHEIGRLMHYRVLGALSSSPDYCGQGALYLTLSVDEVAPSR